MTPLFAYSLVPVVSVSTLLFLGSLIYGRSFNGLTIYCGAIALWAATLLLHAFPATAGLFQYSAQIGALVPAAFIHTAFDLTGQKRFLLVWLSYGIAAVICLSGIIWPGLLYQVQAETLQAGPAFWPAMVVAMGGAALPLLQMMRSYGAGTAVQKRQLLLVAASGLIGFCGAFLTVLSILSGLLLPYPMLMVLGSLLLLTGIMQNAERASGKRLMERSVLYAAMTAMLSAGFLFGLLTLVDRTAEPLLGQYHLGNLFLMFMAALAIEPLRRSVLQFVGRKLLGSYAAGEQLAQALAEQETRADQAERLAELGQFAAAVAHEVRNPLGVISANVRLLQRQGANAQTCAAVEEQVKRASHFVDDLLSYGRPRPLELRLIDLGAVVQLARSTAITGLGSAENIDWQGFEQLEDQMVEADQAQMHQLFVILFENALQALVDSKEPRCRVHIVDADREVIVTVEDSGPGIPGALLPTLFLPFVTGRKREQANSGTGLGLAIARSIVERHQGSIQVGQSELGGALFTVSLPLVQLVQRSE